MPEPGRGPRLTVDLDGDVDRAATEAMIVRGADAVLADLGLTGPVELELRPGRGGGDAVVLRRDGRRRRVPRRRFDYFTAIARPAGADPADESAAVAAAVVELLRRWPGFLVGDADVDRLAAAAGAGDHDGRERLRPVFEVVADHGVPLGDTRAVADVLGAIRHAGGGPDDEIEALIAELRPRRLEVMLRAADLEALTRSAGERSDMLAHARRLLYAELGIVCPPIRFTVDDELDAGTVAFRISGVRTAPRLVRGHGAGVDPEEIARWLHAEARRYGAWMLDDHVIRDTYLHELWWNAPATAELIEASGPVRRLTQVLRLLVEESVSVRPLRRIAEAIVEFDWVVADASRLRVLDDRLPVRRRPTAAWADDARTLASFARLRLGGQIVAERVGADGRLPAITLSPELEDDLLDTTSPPAARHSEAAAAALVDGLEALRRRHGAGPGSPVLVTTSDVRATVRWILAEAVPPTAVFAAQEIPDGVPVENVAVIGL